MFSFQNTFTWESVIFKLVIRLEPYIKSGAETNMVVAKKGGKVGYYPKDYWEKRLSEKFNLSGVGRLGFSEYNNKWIYKAKVRTLKRALLFHQIKIQEKAVCDIGCGTGFFINFYKSERVKYILGIDITKVSIENLKKEYSEYAFVEADITSPSLVSRINRKFNILNVFDVLYHIKDNKAFKQAIINISNLTNDEGLIFISDSCGSKNIDVVEHVTFRSRKTYEMILNENGIEIIAICPLYYLLNQPIFGKSINRFLRRIGSILDDLFVPVYYYLDRILLSPKRNNLNLVIAKKMKV